MIHSEDVHYLRLAVQRPCRWNLAWLLCLGAASFVAAGSTQDVTGQEIAFRQEKGKVIITAGGKPLAFYVYEDERISRPYFAHVHAPCGVQVTRSHPPGKDDPQDHATMHPGIWLAFGDIGGQDYWRLKARVVHDGFQEKPEGGAGRGSFSVKNRYLSGDGRRVVCREVCSYTILVRPAGYLILHDSTFFSDTDDFTFGDQEEMGLGLRVATPMAVKQRKGGRILDSKGRVNEREVWGKQAEWCDYSGTVNGVKVGVTVFPDPGNFRRSWYHARDYGFVAANPFGRKAMTGGEESRILVRKGEKLHLRFGLLLHGGGDACAYDPAKAYRDYLEVSGVADPEGHNGPVEDRRAGSRP